MKKFLVSTLLICLLLFAISSGYCADYTNWGGTDRTRQLGRQLPRDVVHLGQERDGVSVGVSDMVSTSTAVPLGYGVVRKYISSTVGQAGTLANGYPGQILNILIVSRAGSGTFILTATNAMFTSITFNAVGDSVTLLYTGEGRGWMAIDQNSVTVAISSE